MNYYDEEIKIDRATPIKLEKIPSASKGSRASASSSTSRRSLRAKKPEEPHSSSTLTHNDDDEDGARGLDEDGARGLDEDSSSNTSESETENSKEFPVRPQSKARVITPASWENLPVPQEIKDIFSYINKYTPQDVDVGYSLEPFIPDYIPAVGNVDSFVKVIPPPAMDPSRQKELDEHFAKAGLYFLDEPSGHQTDPGLLAMKMGVLLTNSKSSQFASQIPIAKAPKDVDKWIKEVEDVYINHSTYELQPDKDIEAMMIDWPRNYATVERDINNASLDKNISLVDYIHLLCKKLDIECPPAAELTQVQCIQKVYTLFCMYLAANHSYD